MREVEKRGWAVVRGINNDEALLKLALTLGPVLADGNRRVTRLSPRQRRAAPETFSDKFGTGAFPLHTDTAFWPWPAKLIAMRVHGDLRRATPVLTFSRVFKELSIDGRQVDQSIWTVGRRLKHYLPMRVRRGGQSGCRFDPLCMAPANDWAREIEFALRDHLAKVEPDEVNWEEGAAIVLDNWSTLHGRGSQPQEEDDRILTRIYIGAR